MIGLRDRLAHLNYRQACKLLGPKGPKLIREGGRMDIDPEAQVNLGADSLTVKLNGLKAQIRLDDRKPGHLAFTCSQCNGVCEHIGAAFPLVLEEKLSLGLAAPPKEKPSGESLDVSEQDLIERALEERRERVRKEKIPEILLGEKPAEPVQERIKLEAEAEAARLVRKEALSQAGGQLLIHAFAFMGELLARKNPAPETDNLAGEVRERLAECLEQDEKGKP